MVVYPMIYTSQVVISRRISEPSTDPKVPRGIAKLLIISSYSYWANGQPLNFFWIDII